MSKSTETIRAELVNGLSCELPASSARAVAARTSRTWSGPTAQQRLRILRSARKVAMVGVSPSSSRASYFVATYLAQDSDYDLYFVNPRVTEIMGRRVYPNLASLPVVPDIVDVFRRSSETRAVVDEALEVGARTVWMQQGIWNEDAARFGESSGLTVVMDRCMKIEHARFSGKLHLMGFDTGQISARKGAFGARVKVAD